MKERLAQVIADRKTKSGLSWRSYAQDMGVVYTVLFRFSKGQDTLGMKAVQTLASKARSTGDAEFLHALASYALNLDVEINLN